MKIYFKSKNNNKNYKKKKIIKSNNKIKKKKINIIKEIINKTTKLYIINSKFI